MALSGKQRRHLRGLGHHLDAVVHIGKGGIDEGLIGAVDAALETHELIKVKVGDAAPEGRHESAAALAAATRAEIAQVLGYSILLYRAREKDPTIRLPTAAAADAEPDADDPGDE
jgi:RNA-binding protein